MIVLLIVISCYIPLAQYINEKKEVVWAVILLLFKT